MQTLATYVLEFTDSTPDKVLSAKKLSSSQMILWLQSKGARLPLSSDGNFTSKTGDNIGNYKHSILGDEIVSLEELTLEETTRNGQKFITYIAQICLPTQFIVYVSLSATSTQTIISPVATDPRCPKIVRELIRLDIEWTIAGNKIHKNNATNVSGSDAGARLADWIQSKDRAIPLLVISKYDGEPIWPDISSNLSYDLVGLSEVISIDEDASFALTDKLGKRYSCYNGAIRLYWPVGKYASENVPAPSFVWTVTKLISADTEANNENRFRGMIRRKIMSVAALSIVPPKEIREIQSGEAIKRIKRLEENSGTVAEFIKIAEDYANDNTVLRNEIGRLQSDLSIITNRAENAEAIVASIHVRQAENPDDFESDDSEIDEENIPPSKGETRFYKKIHSKPAYDVLVKIQDCGHNAWQNSAGADKAKKGIEKHEGTNEWKSVQHCAKCTGGGVWKVRW